MGFFTHTEDCRSRGELLLGAGTEALEQRPITQGSGSQKSCFPFFTS